MVIFWIALSAINAAELTGTFEEGSNQAHLVLTWMDSELVLKTTVKKRELLLRFDQPIQLSKYPDLLKQSRKWIEEFVVSYDTVFIKLIRFSEFEIDISDSQKIQIRIKNVKKRLVKSDTSKNRLRAIKVRLLLIQGKSWAALEILDQLIVEQPTEISNLLIKADIIYQLGRRKEAMELVLIAEKISPDNVSVKETKNRFLMAIQPFFLAEKVQKETCDDLSEQFNRIQFEARPTQQLAVGIKLSSYEATSHIGIIPVLAEEASQIEIYSNFEQDNGSRLNLSLFINTEASPGLAGEYTQYYAGSVLTTGLDFRRPNWEFFYSQVEANQKHRLRLRYQKAVSPQISYTIFNALNQYQLKDLDVMPTSLTLQGGVAYYLTNSNIVMNWLGVNSDLGIGYDLDIEEPIGVDESAGLLKSSYIRWVSSPRINIGKQYKDWDFSGYLGYAFRIYGSDGRFWGGKVLFKPRETLDFSFKLDRYIDENSCLVSLMSIGMKWLI